MVATIMVNFNRIFPFRDSPLRFPRVIDRYRLLSPLGRGGTGVVCKAEDMTRNRRVAIKLIANLSLFGVDQSQVLREARLASQVQHPLVVTHYDSGLFVEGVYLVMELITGPSLQTLLCDGHLPWRLATEIMCAACASVIVIHDRGIIHRDIKPANFLCSWDGVVKLADFGLARFLDSSEQPTSWKRLAGTPHYMSPEQCRDEEYDERTDIYSLGATYYTLLTGRTPYADTTPMQIMFEHCSSPVPDPCKAQDGIPRDCADIVMRSMAKNRADRYQNARAMRHALLKIFGERPSPWQI